jgi:hypothetical protein
MAEFDWEELKAAFEAGKIPISDDNIRRMDGLLRSLAQQYRARKVAREQDLNGQLTRLYGSPKVSGRERAFYHQATVRKRGSY